MFLVTKKGKVDFWDLSSALTINSQSYLLVADIATMSGYIADYQYVDLAFVKDYDAQADGVYGSAPINAYYGGTLEGLGHTISNLTITDTTTGHYDALMSNSYGGNFNNIGLVNVRISAANNSYAGGFAGSGNARFENVFVTGSITAGQYTQAGGLIGALDGHPYSLIDNSYSAATVTADLNSTAGGLAGNTYEYAGLISDSHATGNVTGGNAGGLVGSNYGADIQNSYAMGTVRTVGVAAGGLVGQDGGNIQLSFATGRVFAGDGGYAGGLIGYAGGQKIYYNYATGKVVAGDNSSAGGLVGENTGGDIRYGYATGTVKAGADANVGSLVGNQTGQLLSYSYGIGAVTAKGGSTIGGLVGIDYQRKDIFRTYWDLDTTGISNPAQGAGSPANDYGIEGLTTTQFQSGLPKGFDKSVWAEDPSVNSGFPYLRSLKPR
jgi:hypothetical protein